jgi:hypothetical protein
MFSDHMFTILYEMCQRVGADYHSIDFQTDWYTKYKWSVEEENSYKVWLFEYLRDNKQARKELMRFPTTKQKHIEQTVNFFVSMYGFVTCNDDMNETSPI